MNSRLEKDAILVEAICKTIPDPIFIIDEKGTYIEVFGGNERMLYDSGDYLKKNTLHEILPKRIADRFVSTINKAIDTNTLQIIEYELRSIDMRFNPMDGPKAPQWYEGRVFPFQLTPEGRFYVIWTAINITEKKIAQRELNKALREIKVLKDIIPICFYCKKIRDDKGYWNRVEAYIESNSDAELSHSICPECAREHHPDADNYDV